jgi:filamentous hemagglutinin family protein
MLKKILIFINALLLWSANLGAQIATDGSLGPGQNLSGPNYQIDADLGQRHGSNLFHSFQKFNLTNLESATFSGPNSVQNVISRVTGGHPSSIDGTIRSTIPNADMYFLNPYGIMFGPNASLDVPGSFHASTADYLRFGDGREFHAKNPSESLLTIAPVEAFGFFGQAKPIDIQGSFLETPIGQTLSLVGGDLTINEATLVAESGQINLVAVGNVPALIPLSAPELAQQIFFGQQGTITLTTSETTVAELWQKDRYINEEAQEAGEFWDEDRLMEEPIFGNIDVSGEGGGQVFIRAGQFVASSSAIFADTYGNIPGARIDIAAEGEAILKQGTRITAENCGNNPMGQITINAKEALILSGFNEKIQNIIKDENPGAKEADLIDEWIPQSASRISTANLGIGTGGNIQIKTSLLSISPGLIGTSTDEKSGNAGNIWIEANRLKLEGGIIDAETMGAGQGGNLTIHATEGLSLTQYSRLSVSSGHNGNAGHIKIKTAALILSNFSEINSFSNNKGHAGTITINTNTASLTDNSGLFTTAKLAGAGNINLNVREHLHVTKNSEISAEAQGDEPQDKGGNITIQNPQLNKEGNITIRNLELVKLDQNSRLVTRGFVGDGGNISVFTNKLKISNGSWIDSSSKFGLNGEIRINSLELNENFMVRPQEFLDGSALLNNRCTGLSRETISQFILTIRDILPPSPGDLMTGYYFLDEL